MEYQRTFYESDSQLAEMADEGWLLHSSHAVSRSRQMSDGSIRTEGYTVCVWQRTLLSRAASMASLGLRNPRNLRVVLHNLRIEAEAQRRMSRGNLPSSRIRASDGRWYFMDSPEGMRVGRELQNAQRNYISQSKGSAHAY